MRNFSLIFIVFAITACQSAGNQAEQKQQTEMLKALRLQQAQIEAFDEYCVPARDFNQVTQKMDDLNRAIRKINKPHPANIQTLDGDKLTCAATTALQEDKMVIGEAEWIYLPEVSASFRARIDTGAYSSSIHAQNILSFERDSKNYVRFDLVVDGKTVSMEKRVKRFVNIKKLAGVPAEKRPEIELNLMIGNQSFTTRVNLTDRSHLDYPLLIGRRFLKDIAVVDVSKKYIQPKYTQ